MRQRDYYANPPIGERILPCDRCAQDTWISDLRPQHGGRVCPKCYDEERRPPKRVRVRD